MKGLVDHLKVKIARRPPKRVQTKVGRRASSFTSESRGRTIRHRRPRTFPPRNLAFLPTVREAVLRAGPRLPVRLRLDDLREWVRQGRAPLTILLIADMSASTAWFMEPAARMLSVLYRDAYRGRDNMGLVAIRDGNVEVLHHPTRNLRAVLGSLTRLTPSGDTPLAEALDRGLDVLKQERRRQPFVNPVAVLLSDGHPEPLVRTCESVLDEEPYRRCLLAAGRYRRARVPVIVINPGHGRFRNGDLWWGTRLAGLIAQTSGGKYYGIPRRPSAEAAAALGRKLPLSAGEMQTHGRMIEGMILDLRDRPVDSILLE